MDAWTWRIAAGVVGVLAAVAVTSADDPPDYGFDWVTIGAPGNRAVNHDEAPRFDGWGSIGAVGHEYRMTRTEITVGQWFEFVQAYAPYWDGVPWDTVLTGFWIGWTGSEYQMVPGAERYPATMSWRNAARYCNWLHNGQVNEEWAFEDGAYDASTFYQDDQGNWHDQRAHHPGARYWIPTLSEWVKGAYYDPDRYGPGQEGYWTYPDGGEDILISGYPIDGGETNAGITGLEMMDMDVGSYPHVQSPWGLLDASGGAREWTETAGTSQPLTRYTKGSRAGWPPDFYWIDDLIDSIGPAIPANGGGGIRLASPVPEPGILTISLIVISAYGIRRR